MAEIGFIGLGTMGSAMAARLVNAGHTVKVWNRSQAAVQALVELGAVAATSAADALKTGIAFSMLSNDAAVDEVFSDETLAEAPGALHVNMATVSVDCAQTLNSRHLTHGLQYIAAPVLGRSQLAQTGQLNIVAAGPADSLARANEFFASMGKHVWQVGENAEQANLVKIGVNYNLIHTLQALAESLNLIERGGVSAQTFVEILTDTAYTGTAYSGYGALIANRQYDPPAFSVALGLKDLKLAEAAAAEFSAALPTAPVLHSIFEATLGDDTLKDLDWAAIAEITRRS